MLLFSFIIYLLAGAATFAAFIISVPRHGAPGGRWLVMALFVSTVWMWANAVLHTGFPLVVRLAAANLSLLGSLAGLLFFYFSIEYASPGIRVSGLKAIPLLLFGFGLVLAAAIPSTRTLVYTQAYLDPAGSGVLVFRWGMGYYGAVAVGLAISIMSLTQVGQTVLRPHGTHRKQTVMVLVGLAIPTIAYAVATFGPALPLGVYPAMSMGFSGIAFGMALISGDLLRSVPIGRREFVDTLLDGFLVVDMVGEVVDANPSAGRILTGSPITPLIGRPYLEVLSGWLCNGAPCGPLELGEIVLAPMDPAGLRDAAQSHGVRASTRVVLRSWDIRDTYGRVIGRAIALRDETVDEMARRRLEAATSSIEGWTREMGAVEELLRKVR